MRITSRRLETGLQITGAKMPDLATILRLNEILDLVNIPPALPFGHRGLLEAAQIVVKYTRSGVRSGGWGNMSS